MDLLEDFNNVRTTFSELGHIGERFESGVDLDGTDRVTGPTPSSTYDHPALTVETTVRQASRYARCRLHSLMVLKGLLFSDVPTAAEVEVRWLLLPVPLTQSSSQHPKATSSATTGTTPGQKRVSSVFANPAIRSSAVGAVRELKTMPQ